MTNNSQLNTDILHEISNTLTSNDRCGVLKLQNDSYTFTITYLRNYSKDYENHIIDPYSINMRCICRNNRIIIGHRGLDLYISPERSYIPDIYDSSDLNELVADMNVALDTISELKAILHKYFE